MSISLNIEQSTVPYETSIAPQRRNFIKGASASLIALSSMVVAGAGRAAQPMQAPSGQSATKSTAGSVPADAENFYHSATVTARKVRFKNQYDMGAANRHALNESLTLAQRKAIIAEAAQQRYVEFAGGETRYTSGTVHEITAKSHPIEREFFDFYRTPRGEYTPPGQSPLLTTHPTLTSNTKFMNFYPFNDIETISPRPMLFITGTEAHSREFSEDAYQRAAEPKELYWVPGAGHVDLYDRVSLIPWARLTAFFSQHLGQRGTPAAA